MNKIDENKLMAYLYGELDLKERKQLEAQLKRQPELAATLQQLQTVRHQMGQLEDVDPQVSLVIDDQKRVQSFKFLMPWLSAAAAIVLLILIGFLLETSVSFKGRQLTVEFGATESASPVVNEAQLVPVIHQALQQQEQLLMDRMQKMQADLEQKLILASNQEAGVQKEIIDKDILNEQLQAYRQQQLMEMTGLLEENIASQREELQAFLTDYHRYLEERRIQDLQLIEAGFQTMKENVDRQKTETDEILANILSTTNNTNY